MASVVDPYIWLENLEDDRTREFIEVANREFRRLVGSLPEALKDRIMQYYNVPYVYAFKPCERGVYIIVRGIREYTVYFKDWDGGTRQLLSSREFSEDAVIWGVYPSSDCRYVGIGYTIAGRDEGFLRIIDSDNREVLDELEGSVGNLVWVDRSRYYYARFYRRGKTPDGVNAPAERIFLRSLDGTEEMVFGEGLPTNYMITLYEPREEGRILVLVQYGWVKSRVYYGPLGDPGAWELIFDGGEYLAKPLGSSEGRVYLAYYDGEGLGRIIRVDGEGYSEVVGEQGYPLEQGLVAGDRIYASYLIDASSRIKAYNTRGELLWDLRIREPVNVKAMDLQGERLLVLSESFSYPPGLCIIDKEGKARPFYGHRKKLTLNVREEWAVSSDGTKIHMFIVEPSGEGRRWAIVYGYGGFGVSLKPFYLGPMIPMLEDGVAFVMANLRGGGEYGEKWHRAGMRERKQNVFEDYKAVLRRLREMGYRTIGWGVSNGGLLVAATLTQAPELLDGALIGYPVIDMLRFHKLYIGRLWVTEYGNPDDPKDREYLLKYSPYHNVREGVEYPPTLVYTGLHDDRVHPAHALKFYARLREVGAPVYLRVETASGHMGSAPQTKIKEVSDLYAFIYKVMKGEVPRKNGVD